MEISDMQRLAYQVTVGNGFYTERRDLASRLMQPVSELGEAYNAHRDGQMTRVTTELTDALISLLTLSADLGIDLDTELSWRLNEIAHRPHLHGRAY